MAARLGNVLYWTCTGLAVCWLAIGAFINYHAYGLIFPFFSKATSDQWFAMLSVVVPAGVMYLFGLACRYVLAGPEIGEARDLRFKLHQAEMEIEALRETFDEMEAVHGRDV